MEQDKTIRRLKRQLLIERIFIALVVLFLIGRYGFANLLNRPYAIEVDGKAVAYVDSRQTAESVIAAVTEAPGAEFKEKVTVGRGGADDEPVAAETAEKALRQASTLMLEAWVIFVDGKPGVALPTEEDASQVLNKARERFGAMAKNLMEEPTFKETVTVEPAVVEAALIHHDVVKALDDLVSDIPAQVPSSSAGTKREHVVQSGQIAGAIAQKYGINLDTLARLNPGKNLARLQIGDRLVVGESTRPAADKVQKYKEPTGAANVTVVVRDLVMQNESIPYRTETISSTQMFEGKQIVLSPGKRGLRRVKRAVTYENGIKTGSEIIEESIISQPQPERVAVGIRNRR